MAKSLKSEGGGHNSGGVINPEELKRYTGRGLNLRKMQTDIAADFKDLCAEADEKGVCSKKELRRLVRIASMEQDVFEAQRVREDVLLSALGDFADLPLGQAAMNVNRGAQAETPAARRRGRPSRARQEQAQAHLDESGDFEDPEAKVDADLDRIIGEPAGAA